MTDELCREKRQRVATENGKNLTSQLRQIKFMLRQGFSAGCQHQEEFVMTKNLLSQQTSRKHKLYRDKGSSFTTPSVTTLIIATWKSLLRQKKSFRERPLSRQGNVCHDTERRSIYSDKVMYVAMPKEEETLVATYKQGHDM